MLWSRAAQYIDRDRLVDRKGNAGRLNDINLRYDIGLLIGTLRTANQTSDL